MLLSQSSNILDTTSYTAVISGPLSRMGSIHPWEAFVNFHTWHILDAGSVSSITKYYYFRYFIETLNIFGASYCHEDQDDN